MENTGVRCDVCECRHNVGSCKCDLPEITVTERCTCSSPQVDIPHYCKSYEKKSVLRKKRPLPGGLAGQGSFIICAFSGG